MPPLPEDFNYYVTRLQENAIITLICIALVSGLAVQAGRWVWLLALGGLWYFLEYEILGVLP